MPAIPNTGSSIAMSNRPEGAWLFNPNLASEISALKPRCKEPAQDVLGVRCHMSERCIRPQPGRAMLCARRHELSCVNRGDPIEDVVYGDTGKGDVDTVVGVQVIQTVWVNAELRVLVSRVVNGGWDCAKRDFICHISK